MANLQYYCFLTNIITQTKICESETTFFNFVNLPKREKIPLKVNFHYSINRAHPQHKNMFETCFSLEYQSTEHVISCIQKTITTIVYSYELRN